MVTLVNITVKLNSAGATNMRIESCKIFAELLEGYVNEDSTSMNLIAGSPGGKEVVLALHQDMQLAHDLGYQQIDKISWSELKDRASWVIIKGSNGIVLSSQAVQCMPQWPAPAVK